MRFGIDRNLARLGLVLFAACGTSESAAPTPAVSPEGEEGPPAQAEPTPENPEESTQPSPPTETEVDAEAECRSSFTLLDEGRFEEAREAADTGIESLRAETTPESREALGACLYNRGRALEGLTLGSDAVMDYAESLWIRPNAVVRRRLMAMVPETNSDAPETALAIADVLLGDAAIPDEGDEIGWNEGVSELDVERGRGADGLLWSVVAVSPGGYGNTSAAALLLVRACGAVSVHRLTSTSYGNANSLRIESVRAERRGGQNILVTRLEGGGDTNCGTMDGMMEFQHRTLSISFVKDCRLYSRTFRTLVEQCGGTSRVGVRFASDGLIHLDDPDAEFGGGVFTVTELIR